MILAEENGSTRRNTCHSVTLFIINLTLNDQGLNPGLYCQRPATDCLAMSCLHNTHKFSSRLTENTFCVIITNRLDLCGDMTAVCCENLREDTTALRA
jgi:hypothetical protein